MDEWNITVSSPLKRFLLMNCLFVVPLICTTLPYGDSQLSMVRGMIAVLPMFFSGPAMIGISWDRGPDIRHLFVGIILSIIPFMTVTVLHVLFGHVPQPRLFLLAAQVTANCLFIIIHASRMGRRFLHMMAEAGGNETECAFTSSGLPARSPVYLIILLLILVVFVVMWGVGHIPLQFDNETFHIASAYGLMTQLRPVMWPSVPDNTFQRVNFSRPPLTHFFTAWSITVSGGLPETRVYVSSLSLPLEDRPQPTKIMVDGRWTDKPDEAIAEHRGGNGSGVRLHVEPAIDISPELLRMARLPQALAFILCFPVLFLIGRRLMSLWWTVLLMLLFLSIPDNLFRGVTASTEPMTGLFLLLLFGLFLSSEQDSTRDYWLLLLCAAVLFWTNQKAAVIVGGVVLWRLAREDPFSEIARDPILLGFIGGAGLYVLYGFWCDPVDFLPAFFGEQAVFRYDLFRIPPPEDRIYPDVINLWWQFSRFVGYPLIPVALIAMIMLARRSDRREALVTFWFMTTLILGSILDRRMTRHCAVAVPAIALAPFLVCGRLGSVARSIFLSAILAAIMLNAFTIVTLLNAGYLDGPLPAW